MKRLPNILTVSRIILTVMFVFFLLQKSFWASLLAMLFFLMASLTDYYDGYLAKKFDGVTNFGKLMDPIADKFLMLTAFYIFMSMRLIAAWMFVIIFFREAIVTGIRIYAIRHGNFLAAEQAGKVKTVSQMVSIFVILFFILFRQMPRPSHELIWIEDILLNSIYVLMLFTVVVTLFSGISYLWNNRKFLLPHQP